MTPRHHRTASHHLPTAALLTTLVFLACGSGSSPTEPSTDEPTDPGRVVEPACDDPAPLEGSYDPRAPGYIVVFEPSVDAADARATAEALAAEYGFTVDRVYESALVGFFTPDATPEMVAGLRCEPQVRRVEHDAPVQAF